MVGAGLAQRVSVTAPNAAASTTGTPWRRLALLTFVVAAVTGAVLAFGLSDKERISAWVENAGAFGPVIFAGLFAFLTLAPLPKTAMSAAAGLLLGLQTGILAVYVGAAAGAVMGFGLARLLGRDAVEKWTGPRVARVDDLLRRRGFLGVLVLRLFPIMPFTVLNYGSGLSAVRFLPYLLATLVGMVPGTVVYVALGAYGKDPLSWEFAAAVAAILAFSAAGVLWGRRIRHQDRKGRRKAQAAAGRGPDTPAPS